jgi:hypothetical protein
LCRFEQKERCDNRNNFFQADSRQQSQQ